MFQKIGTKDIYRNLGHLEAVASGHDLRINAYFGFGSTLTNMIRCDYNFRGRLSTAGICRYPPT